jgi:hypothetical protein
MALALEPPVSKGESMAAHHRSITTPLVVLSVLVATRAQAATPFVPLEDRRVIQVSADYFGHHGEDEKRPTSPFGDFLEPSVVAVAPDDEESAECFARAGQLSTVIDSIGYMAFEGGAEGGWTGAPEGSWSATSLARIRFRLLSCTIYTLQVTIDQGDCPGLGVTCTDARLEGLNGVTYEQFDGDLVQVSGRLAAGEYALEGRSALTSSEPSAGGGAYHMVWNCFTCPWSLIKDHPKDKKVPAGADPTLIASANVPTGSMSYQWRLNLQPLVDDGRIVGSVTPVLTIHNMVAADTGYYDVVFTDRSNPNNVIAEPSQVAHLEIDTVTGVPVDRPQAPRAFTLSPASPNPFARGTSFRYEAARPMQVTMAIYNVAGARVRTLVDGLVSGAHTITWDGALQSGTRAPAGIYYLVVDAAGLRETRKLALLR